MTDFSQSVRALFPQYLTDTPVYCDSAASSLTPTRVMDAVDAYYKTYRANTHRGLYPSAVRATHAFEEARAEIARFIGAEPGEIIFTAGATDASNRLFQMLRAGRRLTGDMVTSIMEHHAVVVPMQEIARAAGVQVRYLPLQSDEAGVRPALDMVQAEAIISEGVSVVSTMLASNVTGTILPVADLAVRAHAVGALLVSDITAAIGHMPINVRALGIDAAFFSGHKMFGPTGIGVLWVRGDLLATLPPVVWGGGMIAKVTTEGATWAGIPDRFEPGTPNIAGAIGLGEAVRILSDLDPAAIHASVQELVATACRGLAEIPGVRVFAAPSEQNIGTVAFVVDGVHPHDVAQVLADRGVAVRPGHHCAEPYHHALGVNATTRASFHGYNNAADVAALLAAVRAAQEFFTFA